jgi:hypothetical protein
MRKRQITLLLTYLVTCIASTVAIAQTQPALQTLDVATEKKPSVNRAIADKRVTPATQAQLEEVPAGTKPKPPVPPKDEGIQAKVLQKPVTTLPANSAKKLDTQKVGNQAIVNNKDLTIVPAGTKPIPPVPKKTDDLKVDGVQVQAVK